MLASGMAKFSRSAIQSVMTQSVPTAIHRKNCGRHGSQSTKAHAIRYPRKVPATCVRLSFSESLHVRLITEIAPIAAKIGRLEPKICATASAIPTESAVLTAR